MNCNTTENEKTTRQSGMHKNDLIVVHEPEMHTHVAYSVKRNETAVSKKGVDGVKFHRIRVLSSRSSTGAVFIKQRILLVRKSRFR